MMAVPVLSSELREFIDKLNRNSEDIREYDALMALTCREYHEIMENDLADFSNYLHRCMRKAIEGYEKIAGELTSVLESHVKYAAVICDDGLRGQLGNDLYGYIRGLDRLVSELHVSAGEACEEFNKAIAFGVGDAYDVAARWEDKFANLYMAVHVNCERICECLMKFVSVYSDLA